MESLIGKNVRVKIGFPLDNEIFEIIGVRKSQIEILGDFSGGTHKVSQSTWIEKDLIKEFIFRETTGLDGHKKTHNKKNE